jgi:hypothetical protein
LLADEWSTSSTFVQNDETDQRAILENNSSVTTQFRNLNRARTAANLAIKGLREFRPSPASDLAVMYFVRGFAEMQLAQDFCNGIPLTDASGPEITFAARSRSRRCSASPYASLDTAIALSSGTDAASVNINRAARIARARALLGIDQRPRRRPASRDPDGLLVRPHVLARDGDNILWSQPASQMRYTCRRQRRGKRAQPARAQRHPVPLGARPTRAVGLHGERAWRDTSRAQDGLTYIRRTALWQRTTPVAVVNGLDARLVEAEARLRAGDGAGMLAILNALRATPPRVGRRAARGHAGARRPRYARAAHRPALPEKAFWTFGRGQRLGDLRRLVRQYGRTPEQVIPTERTTREPSTAPT